MTSAELTLREHEILRLIALGLDNQAIADQLFISPNTVKTHISNIYKKIEVTNRVQAIIWATEHLVGHFHLSGNSDHDCAASGSMLECGNHGMINLLGKLTQ